MKTLKFKFIVPVLAVAFAISSAFATASGSSVSEVNAISGYIDAPEPCQQAINCSLTPGPVCTNGMFGAQVFGKHNPSDTTCPRVVYQP
ncbi:DUF6520 family protein [Formosa sp. A9]|uniref:DUF6520 family protein n=1 Tax=Formosa sp. A9 TaxID=3442641 RepID=UPI003EBF1DC7